MTRYQSFLANPSQMRSYGAIHHQMSSAVLTEDLFVQLYGDQPSAFWLDSSLIVPGLSRWSFMGDLSGQDSYELHYDVEKQIGSFFGSEGEEPVVSTQSLFDFLETHASQQKLADLTECPDIPFLGGHVGYFGYELKTLTCGVASPQSALPDACFIFCTRFVAFDHDTGTYHVIALHDTDDEASTRNAQTWVDQTCAQLQELPSAPAVATRQATDRISFRLRHNHDAYVARIERCLEEITAGETYEVCLTNEISANVDVEPLDLYRVLRHRNPAPYSAFLKFRGFSICCSSPERFLRIDRDANAETKPIKGTAKRSPDPAQDRALAEELQLDEKSRSENLMIVDLMRNDLGRVCELGSVHVPSLMHIESYKTVHQLVSVIRGRIRQDETQIGCIISCFPGGSMTGAPKIRTLELIDQLEGGPRGVYSGAIGFLSLSGEVDLNIVIRTIVCEPGRVSIGCGGAIVALSDAEDEFNEIILKATAPMAAIAQTSFGDAEAYDIIGASTGDVFADEGSGCIRLANAGDKHRVTAAVTRLLQELGGPGPHFDLSSAQAQATQLIETPEAGFVVVAEQAENDDLVGVATVSSAHAIRASGTYGILQECWISEKKRGKGLGQRMLKRIDDEAQRRGWPFIEVTLPGGGSKHLEQIKAFYQECHYTPTGQRFRRRYS